ncbi:MAG: precorrin-8X methylmutase [Chloroflexi bacterium]|nr:precorrin-8X methylmutase [Chloroflexota bacterium]
MDSAQEKRGRSLVARYALPPTIIEERSFEAICGLVPALAASSGGPWSEAERRVILRIVHTTGDPALAEAVRLHPAAVQAGVAAVSGGSDIVTDVKMVAAGISRRLAERTGCRVRCAINAPEVIERARADGTTRAVAAMRHLAAGAEGKSPLDGGIVAIGNAPTALLALLDLVDQGLAHPALIVGMPVGFIAAAESKAARMARPVPYITIPGTRGGSTIAAATVNAILLLADKAD